MHRLMSGQLVLVLGVAFLASGCMTTQAASQRHSAPDSMNQAVLLLQDRVARLESQLDTMIEEQERTRQAFLQELEQVNHVQERMAETVVSQSKRSGSAASASSRSAHKTARNIQLALKKAGYYRGSVDGKLGDKSRSAIKEFQKANRLQVDGKVGTQTWGALKNYL